MKAISEGNSSFGKLAVTLASAIMVAGCFFWAASTFAQTLSVQSDAQPAQPDSIVQLTADAQGLPLLSPDAVPASGTFWLVMPGIDGGVTAPMPCPPKDTSFPIYQIANGQFLVDATGGQVAVSPQFAGQRIAASTVIDALELEASSVLNLITRIQTSEADQQTRATMQAMGMDVPSPGDGGTNLFTPDGASYIAPDYGTNLWIAQVTVLSGNLNGIGTNTQAGIQYDIMSRTNLLQSDWQNEGSIYGSQTTNWTPLTVSQNGRPILFLRLRSDADDGSGLPMWWQLQYFGYVGVNPNAPDPAGDGWSNWQKFQMGLNPNVFYTPPAPQGLTVSYNANAGSATVSWSPSLGPVASYTVDFNGTVYTVSAGVNTLTESFSPIPFEYDILGAGPTAFTYFQVQANYNGGSSSQGSTSLEPDYASEVGVIPGSQGTSYLTVAPSSVPAGTTAICLTRIDADAEYFYGDSSFNTNWDIPLSAFTDGLYPVPAYMLAAPMDGYGRTNYSWWVQTANANGGANSEAWEVNFGNPPFYDGRVQLKQNLIFLLREPNANAPFGYADFTNGTQIASVTAPSAYAYAGFYDVNQYDANSLNQFRPFTDNYLYRNFVYSASDVDVSGNMTTGVADGYDYRQSRSCLILQEPATYLFQANTGTNIPALLAASQTQWLVSYPFQPLFDLSQETNGVFYDMADIGISYVFYGDNALAYTFASNARNFFGLPFQSVTLAYESYDGNGNPTGNLETQTLAPGNTADIFWQPANIYPQTAPPQFQTVGYDFWNANTALLPGRAGFLPTNQSGLLLGFVGQTRILNPYGYSTPSPVLQVAGYAKLAVQNGYAGVYGYLGQYFDKAYKIDTNGIVTTNTTGVLSPYGSFFPTVPGPAALVTMPDPDTGQRGTGTVYCISLALDKNHDGNMDLSFAGPDSTSPSSPYSHWLNNNYDRIAPDSDDNTNYEDDVQTGGCPDAPNTPTPDYDYKDATGARVIPTKRDLEDFARLWVCGVTSNLLAALPAGSTITLNWGDVGNPNPNNPTIDLFLAADPDGGIGYLTNETVAAEQTNNTQYPNIARLGPGRSITLNSWQFANGWAGNHFIWCGVAPGSGQLTLTITDSNGNLLVQASQWIQIMDIKQMYERWTVGDSPTNAPASTPALVSDGLPAGVSGFQYTAPLDTNKPYILFVHGWNLEPWEKDRFAETAFKRLYWQGYQGRFGEFRWPTGFGFSGWQTIATNLSEKDNFDSSEYQAWQSAIGLTNLLTHLNAQYPSRVYLLAHSMGNVVAGEALRLAGSSQVVNTYIASQAAVSAHTYDENTNDIPNYSFYYPPWSLAADTPNIYGNWFAGNNGGGVGRVISFYNTHDYALQRSVWQRDELLKPDQYVLENGIHWDYGYDGSVSDPPPWNDFFKQQDSITNATVDFDIVNNLNNRYEVMGYAAQSYTIALGATPVVQNVAATTDLTALWPSPDPLGNNYASHFFHSAEFRGDSVWEWNYWNTLLFSRTLGFNINNQ